MSRQVSHDELVNSVVFNGFRYATLDFQAPAGTQAISGDNSMLPMPLDWEVVPNEQEIVDKVVAGHCWSTTALVFSDLNGYNTKITGTPGSPNGKNLVDFKKQPGNTYKPFFSGYRLLIRTRQTFCSLQFCAKLLTGIGKKRRFSDCTIHCGDEVIDCHRAVLAEASPVFEGMFNSEMSEGTDRVIKLDNTKLEVVKAAVEFVYTGLLEVDEKDLASVMEFADCYQIEDLLIASATRALHVVDVDNVGSIARSMRALASRPLGKTHFESFLENLGSNRELLRAVVLSV